MNYGLDSKIAILGASGHIGKNILFRFSKESDCELFLFSRTKNKLRKIINQMNIKNSFYVHEYKHFEDFDYNVIINCVGISEPTKIISYGNSLLNLTENYDNMILEYLGKNNSTLYINVSSGAAYGEDFANPANDKSIAKINVNHLHRGVFYSIAKINSEAKHRSLDNLNIIDLRLFAFFSRFMDLDSNFFLGQLVSALKKNQVFLTDKNNFFRDYVHPKDFFTLLKLCMRQKSVNDVFDVYSKDPISKFEILDSMSSKYGLKYKTINKKHFLSPTGIKKNYYSISRKAAKIGYKPHFSSAETIFDEIKFFVNR